MYQLREPHWALIGKSAADVAPRNQGSSSQVPRGARVALNPLEDSLTRERLIQVAAASDLAGLLSFPISPPAPASRRPCRAPIQPPTGSERPTRSRAQQLSRHRRSVKLLRGLSRPRSRIRVPSLRRGQSSDRLYATSRFSITRYRHWSKLTSTRARSRRTGCGSSAQRE